MIENMTTELTMLGTGNATVTKCYNTCFTIKTGKNITGRRRRWQRYIGTVGESGNRDKRDT